MKFTFPDNNANLIFDHWDNNGGLSFDAANSAIRAYEDTDLGMQAIRSAGMDAVDVRHLRD